MSRASKEKQNSCSTEYKKNGEKNLQKEKQGEGGKTI